jgi:hypothetical protein
LARALSEFLRSLVVYEIKGKKYASDIGLSPEVERDVGELVGRAFAEGQVEYQNWPGCE